MVSHHALQKLTIDPLVLFDSGDEVRVSAGDDGIRFLLVSGEPVKEPVAWYGPIVMNTQEQLQQAFEELCEGTFLNPHFKLWIAGNLFREHPGHHVYSTKVRLFSLRPAGDMHTKKTRTSRSTRAGKKRAAVKRTCYRVGT